MEIVLLGHMGRDEAAADRLVEQGHKLHVLGQWENPGLVEKAEMSGGEFHTVGSITDVEAVADFVQAIEPDMFFTNFDDALAAGVIDSIKRRVDDKRTPNLLLPSPDKAAAKVEWDKFYLRELIDEINPDYNPVNFMVTDISQIEPALDYFAAIGKEVALKPRNLTGGKGVKVQGKHFDSYHEARLYALEVLSASNQTGIEIQEKLEGHEFTLQLFTDGKTLIEAPATYDYPYREDGNEGPGTGGMGAFSMRPGEHLPFIDQADYDEAMALMADLLDKLKERGHDYKGVLYPTFFKTAEGLKIVEVNARGGDPELVNVLDLMEDGTDLGEVLKLIALGELETDSVRYKKLASAMLYLVSPEYSYPKDPDNPEVLVYDFRINRHIIADHGVKLRFAAAERVDKYLYQTVGSSRVVGLSALAATPWKARAKIHAAIADGFAQPMPLHYRQEVAQRAYIKSLI